MRLESGTPPQWQETLLHKVANLLVMLGVGKNPDIEIETSWAKLRGRMWKLWGRIRCRSVPVMSYRGWMCGTCGFALVLRHNREWTLIVFLHLRFRFIHVDGQIYIHQTERNDICRNLYLNRNNQSSKKALVCTYKDITYKPFLLSLSTCIILTFLLWALLSPWITKLSTSLSQCIVCLNWKVRREAN